MQKEKSSEEQEYIDEGTEEELEEEEEHPPKKKRKEEEKEIEPSSKIEEKEENENISTPEEMVTTQKEPVVPFLELEEAPKIEIERSLNKEIPMIEKEERTISVPVVDLKPPSLTLRRYMLNSEIPEIKKEKRQLIIPKIQLKPVPSVSPRITELDTKIEKPQFSLKPLKVPIYRTEESYELRSSLTSFDTTINEGFIRTLLGEHENQEIILESVGKEKVEQGVTTVAPEAPYGGAEEKEATPDFLDLIFEGGAGRITEGGAKIILLKNRDDKCTEFLKEVCIRVCREQKGGEPTFETIEKIEDLPDKPNSYISPSGKYFDIDLDKIEDEIEKEEKKKELRDSLRDRLKRLLKKVPVKDSGEKSGFILLTTKEKYPETFYRYSDILESINREECNGRLTGKIIKLQLRRLSKSSKRSIASLCWGMVDLSEKNVGVLPDLLFDDVFHGAEIEFNKELEKIENYFQLIAKTSEGEESPLHFRVKLFLVKILAHEKGLLPNKLGGLKEEDANKIKEEISTEKELPGKDNIPIIPDVWVKNDSTVYEVETLFGIKSVKESKTPQKRFQEDVIEKYNNTSLKNLNIVMDNFGFLIHLKDIESVRNFYKDRDKDCPPNSPKVEFYTLDLQNNKIIPFGEVVKRLKEIKEKNEEEISKKDEKEISGGSS